MSFKKGKVRLLQSDNRVNCLLKYNDQDLIIQYKPDYPFTAAYLKSIYAKAYHLYITADDQLNVGDYCFFYDQISRVLEVNETHAKIETVTITSASDAEFINSIKGPDTIKPGDLGRMVHSFNKSQLPKIIATTDAFIGAGLEAIGFKDWTPLPRPSDQFIGKFIECFNAKRRIIDVLIELEQRDFQWVGDKNLAPWYIKVDKNNNITIRKVKDSWNKEEMEKLLGSALLAGMSFGRDWRLSDQGWDHHKDNWIQKRLE